MKLIAYVKDGFELDIHPANSKRAFMDGYHGGYAYGCLPMLLANQHGWEIRSPVSFTAIWNGGDNKDCLAILVDGEDTGSIKSHFGHGIFSFSLPVVFRTEPGFDLVITGPPNAPVDGATPLTGIVEADWLNAFTAMQWQMTCPNKVVRFRKGQPLCQIYPSRREDIESFVPEIHRLSDDPALADYMGDWYSGRHAFNQALKDPDSPERKMKWSGNYRRGDNIYGEERAPDSHRTRLRLRGFSEGTNDDQ